MFKNKSVLAIITARGGSKRLPKKNILPLAGKPLIAWSIIAAQKSRYIDHIIVSTDSLEIAEVSKEYGIDVPHLRPERLATDLSSSFSVLKYELENTQKKYDYIILLQPTSPLRTSQEIDLAFENIDNEFLAVVSVCESDHSPLWANTLPPNLSLKDFIRPELKNVRSQDLPKHYRFNGAIYIARADYYLKEQGFLGDRTKAFIMSRESSIDIDTELDFKLAEYLLQSS